MQLTVAVYVQVCVYGIAHSEESVVNVSLHRGGVTGPADLAAAGPILAAKGRMCTCTRVYLAPPSL